MLDRRRQDAINTAVRQACDVFRSVGDQSDGKGFALAILLLKYISDIGQDRGSLGDDRADCARFVVPEGSDFYALHALKLQSGNGPRIDKALHTIEKANVGLQGVFQGISFDATVLGSVEQKDRVLSQLLEAFNAEALDFRFDQASAAQAVATACDSLIKYIAEISSKRGGEFFTPPEISELIACLMQPKDGDTVGDPCCGTGSLLIACSQLARQSSGNRGCALYGQEMNGSTWTLAKMNMVLHGETQHQLEWGDTLRDPKLLAADGSSLRKFDIGVSTPPISLRDWGYEDAERDLHQRYWRGVPPRAAGDYAFISHMVETLKPESGRMAAVVSLGVLFRGAAERQIRERLIHENLIDGVIALPPKMLPHTGIQVAILVLRKNKVDDSVVFIDASRSYQRGKTQNVLRQTDLDLIVGTYRARNDVNEYARRVTPAEIASNDYDLSVTRYVDATEDEVAVDLAELRAERAQLKAELVSLEAKLAILLEGIDHV